MTSRTGSVSLATIAAPAIGARVLPVTVRAQTGWAIEIDGVARGTAPLFGVLLTEGTHRGVARSADGRQAELLFEVNEDNLTVVFDPPASR